MGKKNTSVSHGSTEAEIISLDAGLRMDGIPALDLWDLDIKVFHSSPNQSKKTKDQVRGDSSRKTTSNKPANSSTVHSPIASKSPRHPVKMIGQVQGDLEQENSIKTQRRVLKLGKRFKKYEETRRFRKRRHQRQRQHLATQSPDIYRLRTAHGEGFLDCETKIWSQSRRQN